MAWMSVEFVGIDGLYRRFDTLADVSSDLERPLTKFGNYLRKRAIERARAQDFAPLAESTLQKRAQKGLRQLERKITRDVRKATRRDREAPRGLFARLFGAGRAAEELGALSTRGVKNRMAVLAEFQRRHRAGYF